MLMKLFLQTHLFETINTLKGQITAKFSDVDRLTLLALLISKKYVDFKSQSIILHASGLTQELQEITKPCVVMLTIPITSASAER